MYSKVAILDKFQILFCLLHSLNYIEYSTQSIIYFTVACIVIVSEQNLQFFFEA